MPETNEQQNNPTVHKGGVKTEEGKAISRYNAQKHAILRETLTDYEKVDVGQVYDDLIEDFQPSGRFQELLVEIIASHIIRLQRIAKAESESIKSSMAVDVLDRLNFRTYKAMVSASTAEQLLVYSRYQTATENRIYRALMILEQLKTHEQSKETTK